MTADPAGEALERHRRAGRGAHAAGRRAEELVEWSCVHLHQAGRAWVRKTEPAVGMGYPGRGAGGRLFFRAGGPPDFIGALAGGRAVCFDLKSTQDASFDWRIRSGRSPREALRHRRTKERQIADLEAAGKMNAVAGVLVVLGSSSPKPRALWVDWRGARALGEGRWTADAILRLLPSAEAAWPGGEAPRWLEAALEARRRDGGD